MEKRLGEDEGLARRISAEVDVEHRPDECLGLVLVVLVGLAGVLATGPDGGRVGEVARNVVVEIEVGEDDLAAACAGELIELEDEHLRELVELLVGLAHEERSEEQIHSFPADGSRVVRLKRGCHLDHVADQHFGVLGGLADARDVGEVETVLLDVLE